MRCLSCPRRCAVDRAHHERGFCGESDTIRIARAAIHPWEEPPISGTRGSGTVFFCGCNLRCVFCQNHEISRGGVGRAIADEALIDTMLRLADEGAHNINLVTPTPFARRLIPLLEAVKPRLSIPIVYNCGGYEDLEVLAALDGLVDVYLPDFKYRSSELAARYSGAADYPEVCERALARMFESVGEVRFDADGLLTRGMIVRHLVLPGSRADSLAVVERLAALLPIDKIRLSLMSQYTPMPSVAGDKLLSRRVTRFEYQSVLDRAVALGFEGYFQAPGAADSGYIPPFGGAD